MALLMTCNITVGNKLQPFNSVVAVEVESSWQLFTDTAIITMPRNLQIKQGEQNTASKVQDLIQKGDEVKIELGYNGSIVTEFEGYVSALGAETPIEISCEDKMWLLKQTNINESWKSITLKNLIAAIVPDGVGFEVGFDTTFKAFRIPNLSAVKVLDKLRSDYGIYSYFRYGVLYVGFPYAFENTNEFNYQFGHNIIDYGSLKFVKADDVKVKVKAISILKDNTKIEVDLGDADGELRTLHFYNIESEVELKAIAQSELDGLKREGYRGHFTTFGEPSIEHGDTANIIDLEYPERSGKYLVDKVLKKFSSSGYRRQIYLGKKVSE